MAAVGSSNVAGRHVLNDLVWLPLGGGPVSSLLHDSTERNYLYSNEVLKLNSFYLPKMVSLKMIRTLNRTDLQIGSGDLKPEKIEALAFIQKFKSRKKNLVCRNASVH